MILGICMKTFSPNHQVQVFTAARFESMFHNLFHFAVLKEGLQILAHFANERSSTALTTEQINLGLKQIRVENLIDVGQTPNNAGANKDKENNFAENIPGFPLFFKVYDFLFDNDCEGVKQSKGTQERNTAESYRLQLIIELLRMHIVESKQTSSNQKDFGNKSQSKRITLRPKIESLFDASINSQQLQQRILDEELDFQQDADVEGDVVYRRGLLLFYF